MSLNTDQEYYSFAMQEEEELALKDFEEYFKNLHFSYEYLSNKKNVDVIRLIKTDIIETFKSYYQKKKTKDKSQENALSSFSIKDLINAINTDDIIHRMVCKLIGMVPKIDPCLFNKINTNEISKELLTSVKICFDFEKYKELDSRYIDDVLENEYKWFMDALFKEVTELVGNINNLFSPLKKEELEDHKHLLRSFFDIYIAKRASNGKKLIGEIENEDDKAQVNYQRGLWFYIMKHLFQIKILQFFKKTEKEKIVLFYIVFVHDEPWSSDVLRRLSGRIDLF